MSNDSNIYSQNQANGRPIISPSEEVETERAPTVGTNLSQLKAPAVLPLTQQINITPASSSNGNLAQAKLTDEEKVELVRRNMRESSGNTTSRKLTDLNSIRHKPEFTGQLSEWKGLRVKAESLVETAQKDKATGAKVAIAGLVVEAGTMISWVVAAANVMRHAPGVYGKLAKIGLATVPRAMVAVLGENVRASGANLADQGQQTEQLANNYLYDIANNEYQLISFQATRSEIQMQGDLRRAAVSKRNEPFRPFSHPLTGAMDARGINAALDVAEESKKSNVIARNLGEIGDFFYKYFRRDKN